MGRHHSPRSGGEFLSGRWSGRVASVPLSSLPMSQSIFPLCRSIQKCISYQGDAEERGIIVHNSYGHYGVG